MSRHIVATLLSLCVPSPARAQTDSVLASRAAYREAVRAHEAHDVPAFLRYARQAQQLRPRHGGVLYALASACAMSGDTIGALARNAAPLVRGRRAFSLSEPDLLTEGIAYDPRSHAFFVGSVHRRRILRVDRGGRVTQFVPSGPDLPWAPLGMRVDSARQRLWVAAAAVPQSLGYEPADSLRSGLFRFRPHDRRAHRPVPDS